MLKAASDYHELNAGAHRKPPKILTAPALIWHLAFWTHLPESGGDGKKSRGDPAEIKNLLDGYILALCGSLAEKAANLQLTPCISGVCLLFRGACHETSRAPVDIGGLTPRQDDIFRSTTRAVSLQFTWQKLDVTIRFEVYTEYFSISTFVELDKTREKTRSGSLYSDIDTLNNNIRLILGYLGTVGQSAAAGEASARPDRHESSSPSAEDLAKEINNYCFKEFWEAFAKEILSHDSLAAYTQDEIFQQIFADFRGFIASDQAIKFNDDDFFKGVKPAIWGQRAKSTLLPLIQHRDRSRQTRYECAVNYMLDGRALYMSTLGPQIPSIPEDQRIPVEFIVYAHQRYNDTTVVNKWQLGRLVSQILLLGTLRLAALKDVKSMHEAGQFLGQLDEYTQAARDAIATTKAQVRGAKGRAGSISKRDQSAASSQEEEMDDKLGTAHQKLNTIAGTFLTKTGSGLSYRIERSRYYVKQFEDNVTLLRIRRVEGDQPYDQFIRRRLGSEFDFIDRLGIRYERAVRAMATLDQEYLAIIQNKLVERANKIQTDIHTIQEWGEAILLGILVPYYMAHLLVLIVGERADSVPMMTVNVWIVFVAIAVARFFKILKPSIMLPFFLVLSLLVWLLLPLEQNLLDRLHRPSEQEAARSELLATEAKILEEIQQQGSKAREVQRQLLESQQTLQELASEGLTLFKDQAQSRKLTPVGPRDSGAPQRGATSPKP
jgi:hypothetical protein